MSGTIIAIVIFSCTFGTDFEKLILTIETITYVWRCNPNSITRSSEYNFWGIFYSLRFRPNSTI